MSLQQKPKLHLESFAENQKRFTRGEMAQKLSEQFARKHSKKGTGKVPNAIKKDMQDVKDAFDERKTAKKIPGRKKRAREEKNTASG